MQQTRAFVLGPLLALALLPSGFTAAALPLLRAEWGASATAIGWVFAAYQVGYVVSVLVILPLTDRFPAGKVILACALISSTAFLLFPLLARGVWSAAAVRFFAGLGLAGIYMPGTRVVAAAATPARRGMAVGAYVSAFYLGGALSLWASGLLLSRMDWEQAALVLAGIAALGLPLALIGAGGSQLPPGKRVGLDVSVMREGPVTRTILAYTGHSWELYISRGWMAAFVASVLSGQGLDLQSAAAQGSQWAALMAGLGVPGVLLGGWFSDRIGRAKAGLLIAISSGMISLGFGFMGGLPWWLFVVIGCAFGLIISADSAVYSTAITEFAPRERLGSAQAMQAFIGFGATIVAPVMAGWMLDKGLGWGAVFAVGGLIGIPLALPLIKLVRW